MITQSGSAPDVMVQGDGGKPGERPWFRRSAWWVVAALAVAVALVAFVLARPTSADAMRVERRDVARTILLTGRVRPPSRPQVGATTAGTVQRVLVREGDRVSGGQLLLQLDDALARATVAEARAALASVRGRAQSEREQAATAVQQAARDLERTRRLNEAGAVSARDVEAAMKTAADARSAADAVNARVAAGAFAEVARARAALAAAEAQLANLRIAAPAAATVVARLVDAGDVVVPGQPLLELATVGASEIVAVASEDNLADLRVGAHAVVSADAYPAQRFTAQVAWISPAVDPTQGTVEVRLGIPDQPAYLVPDMTVSVNIDVASRRNAVVVPREAVHDLGTAAPWVLVEQAGRAVRRPIQTGIVGESMVEVLQGLAEGEQVLAATVKPDARIRVRR